MALPQGWASTLFKTAVIKFSIVNDKKIKQRDYLRDGMYPVIDQGADFIGGYTDDESLLVNTQLPAIVFGDHTKVVKLVQRPFCAGADGIKIVYPPKYFKPKCLYYFICVLAKKIPDKGYARHYQYIEKETLPIPPITEQHRIVAKIDALFSELDKGVEMLQTVRAQLRTYRQAVLKWAFEGREWEMKPFSEIADSRLGKMLDKEKNTGIPREYLRNINVRWFGFDCSDLLEMRIEDSETEKYKVKRGDLLICEGGEPGRCAIWESDKTIAFQKALHRVRMKPQHSPDFLMYYISKIASASWTLAR